MGLNVCGVDMLRANHGPVVMEVNSTPGSGGRGEGHRHRCGRPHHRVCSRSRPSQARPRPRARGDGGNRACFHDRWAPHCAGHAAKPSTCRSACCPITRRSRMSVHVVHGRRPGPTIFVSAAIHGDEVIGVEIVRRLLRTASLDQPEGHPAGDSDRQQFGFLNHSRYLPDRRDLNRSFPGSTQGSLASRLAHLFMTEIVARSDLGIDLHSAAIHRTNLPQIRVSPSKPETMELAQAFGAPLILTSQCVRPGSLRQPAQESRRRRPAL